MSLQRVFETARKMGFPVIVTDVAGREPFVILPLEQFEGLIEDGSPEHVSKPELKTVEPSVVNIPSKEESRVRLESVAKEASEEPEIPLEERFYLEPEGEQG